MKSVFLNHTRLLIGLVAMVFTTASHAEGLPEPTWVKEGVNWTQYQKFQVMPLVIDDVKVIKPAYAEEDTSDWTIDLENLEEMQAIFRDTMYDVLRGNNGYPVVYTEGRDVLQVEVEILSIMPWLKPGSESEMDGHEVETLGSGEITGRMELRDSRTRELLLLLEGEKAVGEKYDQFTAENNVRNVKLMFNKFANRLRNSMDDVHGK